MYRSNKRQLQPALISSVNEMPEKRRRRLEESWAGTFRREFFSRVKEEAFAVLYSEVPSRPNVPVNVLVGLETLKAGYGWSDEELYDHFLYDMQVRYAVGYDSLGEGDFELRTLYNFRRRLSQYNVGQGVNLLAVAFGDITDQQITALAVRTGQQRMDSTQIASNIVLMSRLQLAVEAIQRLYRLLSEAERQQDVALWEQYVGEKAGHYTYRVKKEGTTETQLQAAGEALYRLLQAMVAGYGEEPAYQAAARLFAEQFWLEAEGLQPKANQEISSSSLQSLDDLEASYREKQQVGYRGYVANVTETCDPENGLQLITDVRVAPNTTADSALLVAALPELKQRTDLETLYTDGAFGGPESDSVLREQGVSLIQTAIVGPKANPDRLSMADFVFTQDAQGRPLTITCPQNQTVLVFRGRKPWRFGAQFDDALCATCPLFVAGRCPPAPYERRQTQRFTFSQAQVEKSQRHRRSRASHGIAHNLRAAIEATVRSLKHPFPEGKLPVRGLFRMTCLIVGSAAMTNVRRIQRYLQSKSPEAAKRRDNSPQPGHISHSDPSLYASRSPLAIAAAHLVASRSYPRPSLTSRWSHAELGCSC